MTSLFSIQGTECLEKWNVLNQMLENFFRTLVALVGVSFLGLVLVLALTILVVVVRQLGTPQS